MSDPAAATPAVAAVSGARRHPIGARARRLPAIPPLALLAAALPVAAVLARPGLVPAGGEDPVIAGVELRGEVRIPPGTTVLGTPLGGLSAITYDRSDGSYFALSDDRGTRAPARFYRLTIDLGDGRLGAGDIRFTEVITLTNAAGEQFAPGDIDPEGITRTQNDTFFISSEGSAGANPPVAPFVAEFDRQGRQLRSLPVPDAYLPAPGKGVRDNLAFEPLTITSGDGALVVVGTEGAMAQDGPVATVDNGSAARVLAWERPTGQVLSEHVYPVSPIPKASSPANAYADNGLVELLPLARSEAEQGVHFLAMERSFATGVGNTVRLFETDFRRATDVTGWPSLLDPGTGGPRAWVPMPKRQVADVADLGLRPDNIEGMTWGPTLPDGRQVLILVSDDNFNPLQVTQFVALAMRLSDGMSRYYLPLARRDALPR
jgi:hypothetical protein